MADWDDNVEMDTVDRQETLTSYDNSDKTDFVRKRRNDDQQGNQGGYRRNNNQNSDSNFKRGDRDNSQGGFQSRRDNSQGGGRRRNDNQDNNEGGFNRQNNNQNSNQDNQGGYRRRRNQDESNDQGGGFNRRQNNQDNQGGYKRDNSQGGGRRRNDNQDNNEGGFNRQNNNQNSNQDNQGGFRRRRNQDENNDQANSATFSRRRDQNNSGQDNNNASEGQERLRGRNENNQESGNNDQNRERKRRNRESNDNGAPVAETEESANEKKKENYIPRRYNKDDDDLFENIIEGINFTKFDNIPVQVSGENLPDPIQKFSDVVKHESIIDAVKRSGYKTLTPIQKYAISAISAGRDLMASAQTGSGKTMAFLLPIIQKLVDDPETMNYGDKCSPECLIITPTRELAIQIFEQAMKLTYKNHLKAAVVYGGANSRDQQGRLSYGANVVAAVPGRLLDYLGKGIISLSKLKYFVLDEADRMIDQGFMPDVKRIIYEFDLPEERHTCMFSATFPTEVQKLAQQFLKSDYIFLSVGILGGANQDVKQEIFEVGFKEKRKKLVEILKEIYSPEVRILVFCERKKMADFLAAFLCDINLKSTSIHGDRLQSQREAALRTFKTGETPIMLATSVAARGLDIKGVTHVINYDLPSEIEEYIHRIGRTGRVGNFGNSISFFDSNDNTGIASSLIRALKEANQEVPEFLEAYMGDASYSKQTSTERDERGNDSQKGDNFTNKKENYQASAMEEDDW